MIKLHRYMLASCLSLVLFLPMATVVAAAGSHDNGGTGLSSAKIAASGEYNLKQEIQGANRGFGVESGLGGENEEGKLAILIGKIINAFLGLLGVILVILIIYAGYLWMTAQGNSTQVDKAKTMISQAVIGMVIIMASYAIARFVLKAIINQTTGQEIIQ